MRALSDQPRARVLLVTTLVVVAASLASAEERAVVYLTTGQIEAKDGEKPYVADLLFREVVGQAFLLTARESFGLRTRAATLREPIPDDAETRGVYELRVANVRMDKIKFSLLQQNEVVLEGALSCHDGPSDWPYAVLATEVELLSRAGFVEVLRKAGFTPRERRTREEPAQLREEIDDALNRMNVIAQYHAVRLLHDEIERHGESETALGALVRAYANLAQLTALCHSKMRHAFGARSLLYATRLTALYPDSPYGSWHRAYAFTMLGLNSAAHDDIEAAKAIIDSHELEVEPPTWLALLEPANTYDFRELEVAAAQDGPLQELSALLWFRSVEFSDSLALTLTTGKKVIEIIPHCMRVYTGMHRVAGVSYRHFTTGVSGERFGELLTEELPIVARRHEAVRNAVEGQIDLCTSPTGRATIAAALVEETQSKDESQEPTASVLGRLIEEFNFLHISERATFLRDYLSVDAVEYIDSVRPAFERHPLAPLIEACRHRLATDGPGFQATLGELEIHDVNWISTYWLLFHRVPIGTEFKNISRKDLLDLARQQQSMADVDLLYMLDFLPKEQRLDRAAMLARLGSESPKVQVVLIQLDWENVRKYLDEWVECCAHHPAVALALAKRFSAGDDKDLDRAEALLKRSIQTVPDFRASRQLVGIYFGQGLREKALQAAEDVLEAEDFSLDHASLSSTVAYTLIREGKYAEALPWAQRSARSGAGWGLKVLADCNEAMGNLEEAEQILEFIDRRYGDFMVYNFRARRGQGNLEEAYAAKRALDQRKYPGPLSQAVDEAFHFEVLRDHARALDAYQELYKDFDNWYTGVLIAALADLAGNAELRDQMLADVARKQPLEGVDATHVELARTLQQAHKSGELNLDRVAELGDERHPEVNFFAASYFDGREDRKQAIAYYKKAARSPRTARYPGGRAPIDAFVLSWIRLRELDANPTLIPASRGFPTPDVREPTDKQ